GGYSPPRCRQTAGTQVDSCPRSEPFLPEGFFGSLFRFYCTSYLVTTKYRARFLEMVFIASSVRSSRQNSAHDSFSRRLEPRFDLSVAQSFFANLFSIS